MKQKVKKVTKTMMALIIACSVILVSLIGLTVAYFTDNKSYTGTLEFGNIILDVSGESVAGSDLTFTNSRKTSSDATWTGRAMPGDTIAMKFNVGLDKNSEPAYYLVSITDSGNIFTNSGLYYYDSTVTENNGVVESTSTNKGVGKITAKDSDGNAVKHPFNLEITIPTDSEDHAGEKIDIKLNVYAIQQANITEAEAYEKLTLALNGVDLPTVANLKKAITNWGSLTSNGFYYTKDVPAGYNLDTDLTNNLNVANIKVYKKSDTEIAFASDYKINAPESCAAMFSADLPSTAVLTSLDLSNFDTSHVTNMQNMFVWNVKLTNLKISNFDTSNVINMGDMFSTCANLGDLDVSNFDTSKVTNMSEMFYNCSSLTTLDLSNFDTKKVTNMGNMFGNTFVAQASSVLTIGDKFVIDGSNTFDKATLNTKTNFRTAVTLKRGTTTVD